MKYLAVLLVCMAAPAAAQELVFSAQATESCLASGTDYRQCVGRSAEACMENTPGGWSTVAMGGCLDRELSWWDDRLNTSYRFAMDHARKMDAENDGFGPSQMDALRDMQRAWIPFRDRKCDWARSQWGGGTGGGPAALECLMRETADQTWYIESVVTPG